MRQKTNYPKDSVEKTVKDIHRATRRKYSPQERSRIVLEGVSLNRVVSSKLAQ